MNFSVHMTYVVDDGHKEVAVMHLVQQGTRGRLVVIDRRPQVTPQLCQHTREEEKDVRQKGTVDEGRKGWERSRGPEWPGGLT